LTTMHLTGTEIIFKILIEFEININKNAILEKMKLKSDLSCRCVSKPPDITSLSRC